ncbi:MAG: dihydrolipoamide acetyltransferase family protein [Thermoguttaceae bacterium]
MADFVPMPQMGISEESAVLSSWKVKVGDAVKTNDVLFELETGKSSFEEVAKRDGVVLALLCAAGDEIAVGANVCVIGDAGEKFSPAPNVASSSAASVAATPVERKTAATAPAATTTATTKATGAVSPRARRVAEAAGVDLADATPTGPGGRVIERDVRTLAASGPSPRTASAKKSVASANVSPIVGDYDDKPLSKIRKVIAENMYRSLHEMAQLTLNTSFDATAVLAFRKSAKAMPQLGCDSVTINDLLVFALSRTLVAFPDINAHFLDTSIRRFAHANIAVAVDTPRGLMVPVIRECDTLSLQDVSTTTKQLAAGCREGNIAPDLLTGGSFTVSNLGAAGIESFTPVINPPQVAILGVNTIVWRLRDKNGTMEHYPSIPLSLTFDHRAIDGAPAAKFLQSLVTNLENIAVLLACGG